MWSKKLVHMAQFIGQEQIGELYGWVVVMAEPFPNEAISNGMFGNFD